MPSAQVHIVDGGHFSLDMAANEIAARVREFMDMPSGRLTSIGQGDFRYAFEPFGPELPDPFGTAWLMRFYDHKARFTRQAETKLRLDSN